MNEIDEIIKKKMQQDKYVPNSTQNVIDYTIRNCINISKRPKIKFKNRIITIILSIIMVLLGTIRDIFFIIVSLSKLPLNISL